MRTGYSLTKLAAFLGLAATLALESNDRPAAAVHSASLVVSWLAVAICLLRGLPVLVEAPAFFHSLEKKGE
jgi:hypothetical protein